VQLFSPEDADPLSLQYTDQHVFYFGGDTLFGRYMTPLLIEEAPRRAMFETLTRVTGGLPLIVNLEGVGLKEIPDQLPEDRHVMPADLAVPSLNAINAVAASLANNHAFDLGQTGLEETLAMLEQARVRPLRHGEIVDFGAFRLIALNFVSKRQIPDFPEADDEQLTELCRREARPPLLAFVHWGTEYATRAGPAEYAEAARLLDCGVTAVVGAHSHRASPSIEALQGGAQQITYSLGNLLFDQSGAVASGAILELRIFGQGTFATRLLPIPNLHDFGVQNLTPNAASAGHPRSIGDTAR
jgi:poly-gamma-glutamate synthesis protein (capsule biosynthesis protein)